MNFGAMDLEGLLGQENGAPSQVSEPETKTKVLGSGFSKQERSGPAEEDWRSSKMAKTDDISAPKAMPLHQGTSLLRSNSLASGGGRPQEHMLNFSALKSDISLLSSNIGLTEGSTQKTAFPYYQYTPYAYSRNAGYGSGSLDSGMHVVLSFTSCHQSTWITFSACNCEYLQSTNVWCPGSGSAGFVPENGSIRMHFDEGLSARYKGGDSTKLVTKGARGKSASEKLTEEGLVKFSA